MALVSAAEAEMMTAVENFIVSVVVGRVVVWYVVVYIEYENSHNLPISLSLLNDS